MKKLFFVLLACGLLASCADTGPDEPRDGSGREEYVQVSVTK